APGALREDALEAMLAARQDRRGLSRRVEQVQRVVCLDHACIDPDLQILDLREVALVERRTARAAIARLLDLRHERHTGQRREETEGGRLPGIDRFHAGAAMPATEVHAA